MNIRYTKGERGALRWIIVAIIALVVASYFFDFSVQDAVEDEQTQSNFEYISTKVLEFWDEHLAVTAHYLWDDVFLEIIWAGFIENMERLREGDNTVFEDNAPGVDIETTGDVTNGPIEAGFVNADEETTDE
jgi:hypothetical protein